MSATLHRYEIELYTVDGRCLGRHEVEADLEPAWECAWLEMLRTGGAGLARDSVPGPAEPRWSVRLGAPYIEGFHIAWGAGGDAGVDFPNTYFQSLARRVARQHVQDETLGKQESFRYLVRALPRSPSPATGAPRLLVRRQCTPPAMPRSSLARMRRGALPAGEAYPGDPPVFVPQALRPEIAARARAAGAAECGGVLIGHLFRDPRPVELFVEITDQIPARHVEANANRLTFTPETWHAVDTALAERGAGEIMLGWWHSHPVGAWCESCSPEERADCDLTEGFLSAHDRHLHRTVFPRAYTVALVVSDPGRGNPVCSLFGWRRGVLVRRGFFIRPAARARVRGAEPARDLARRAENKEVPDGGRTCAAR